MKKKLLIGILALSTCFVMTGCDVVGTVKDTVGNVTDKVGGFFGGIVDKITGKEDEEEAKSEYNVEAAKEYLKSQYVDKNTQTRVNYEVLKEFTYLGKTYTVDWSVDKPEAVKLKVRDDCVKVKVTKTLTEDTTYILTATVKAPDGTSAQVGFRRKVLAMSAVVPEVFEGKPVAETPYKFYVFNQQLQQDQYFAGEMNGYYYKTTTDHNKATDIFVEYLEGSSTEFYVYHEVEGGREYFTVEYGLGDDGGYHTNVYLRDTATTVFTYNSQYNAIVTTVNDSESDPNKLTDYFLGNRNTYNTISANNIQYAGSNNVGRLAGMTDRTTIDDADKVARTYRELSLAPVYIGDYEMEVPENGDLYAEVNVKWEVVEGDAVTVDEELLTFANPEEMKEVTLKATITLGEGDDKVEQTKEFTVKVAPKTEAGIIAAVKALADGEAIGNSATLTGTVTKIVSEYDPKYENVTVKMDVNGTELEVYRVKGTGANEIAPGYTITVSGILKNFKGTLEFDSGCTLDAFEYGEAPEAPAPSSTSVTIEEVATANNWADATRYESFTHGNFTVSATGTPNGDYGLNTGKYYDNGKNWRIYQNESPSVTITAAEGKHIVSVKITYVSQNTGVLLLGTAQVASDVVVTVGTSTVTFTVGNTGSATNGQARITAIEVITADGAGTGTPSVPGGDTPVTPPSTTTSTIAQVIAGTKGNTYKAEGTVVAITANGFILQDATDEIFVYMKSAHTYKVGDKVIVEGALDFYNKGAQFAQPTVTLNGTGTLPTAEPTVLTKADCEALVASSSVNCNYVSMTGTLSISGNFINVLFDSTTADISLYYVTDAQKTAISALNGKTVTVEGYAIAIAGSDSPKHISFVLTDFAEYVAPITDADKVAAEKEAITVNTTAVTEAKEFTLSTTPATYSDVVITWTKDGVAISGDELTFTLTPGAVGSEDVTVTLVATITCNGVTDTKEFVINVVSADAQVLVDAVKESFELSTDVVTTLAPLTLPTQADGVAIAWAVKNGDALTEIKLTANPDEDEAVTLVATFSLAGKTATKEFVVTKKALTPAEVVEALYALADGENLPGTYTLTGVIASVDSAYSAQYGNVEVTMTVAGKAVKAFRLAGTGADVIGVGDTITVSGTLTYYATKDSRQFAQGCTLDAYTVCDANKVAAVKAWLEGKVDTATVTEAKEITLPAQSAQPYTEVNVEWTATNATVAEGKLTLTPGAEDVEAVVTATITLNDAEDTYSVTIKVIAEGGEVTLTEKNYSYKLASGDFAIAENQTKTLGGVAWTVSATNLTYIGFDSQYNRGFQFGKGNSAVSSMTVSLGEFSNVSKIVINTGCASSGTVKLEVYVGNTLVHTETALNKTTTPKDYTINVANLSGEVKFVYSQPSTQKAIYIQSVSINYAE